MGPVGAQSRSFGVERHALVFGRGHRPYGDVSEACGLLWLGGVSQMRVCKGIHSLGLFFFFSSCFGGGVLVLSGREGRPPLHSLFHPNPSSVSRPGGQCRALSARAPDPLLCPRAWAALQLLALWSVVLLVCGRWQTAERPPTARPPGHSCRMAPGAAVAQVRARAAAVVVAEVPKMHQKADVGTECAPIHLNHTRHETDNSCPQRGRHGAARAGRGNDANPHSHPHLPPRRALPRGTQSRASPSRRASPGVDCTRGRRS